MCVVVNKCRLTYSYKHCLKSVHIWSYSGPHFPSFGLTPNTDTFYAVKCSPLSQWFPEFWNIGNCIKREHQLKISHIKEQIEVQDQKECRYMSMICNGNFIGEKVPNTEFFLVRFQPEYRKIRLRKNSVFGQYSRSVFYANNQLVKAVTVFAKMFHRKCLARSSIRLQR